MIWSNTPAILTVLAEPSHWGRLLLSSSTWEMEHAGPLALSHCAAKSPRSCGSWVVSAMVRNSAIEQV